MAPPGNNRFFFVHIMKTGGTSLSSLIAANFPPSTCYPEACISSDGNLFDSIEAYLHVPRMVRQVNERRAQLDMVRGHVPYRVRDLLRDDFIAMTIVRDPVERTLSYLKHCRRYHTEHQNQPLEKIYEDSWFKCTFMQNYQTKLFSMSAEESLAETRVPDRHPMVPTREEIGDGTNLAPEIEQLKLDAPGRFSVEWVAPSTGIIEVDERRLHTAMNNLAEVEIVGVTEHYDRFLKVLSERFSWRVKGAPHLHAGEKTDISRELRSRIEADNSYDRELYEFARSATCQLERQPV